MNRSGKRRKKSQGNKKTQPGNDGKRKTRLKPQLRDKYKQLYWEDQF